MSGQCTETFDVISFRVSHRNNVSESRKFHAEDKIMENVSLLILT
jgi:hypothetical protein